MAATDKNTKETYYCLFCYMSSFEMTGDEEELVYCEYCGIDIDVKELIPRRSLPCPVCSAIRTHRRCRMDPRRDLRERGDRAAEKRTAQRNSYRRVTCAPGTGPDRPICLADRQVIRQWGSSIRRP